MKTRIKNDGAGAVDAKAAPRATVTATFTVHGMSCSTCESAIAEKLGALPGVVSVGASREKQKAELRATRPISIDEVRQALVGSPKYTVAEELPSEVPERGASEGKSRLQTYRPLLLVFGFVVFVSLADQQRLVVFDSHVFMTHLMAGFFIGLSYFKFLDLDAFAESFAGYDPIAKRWQGYGYLYPFIELALGLAFVAGIGPLAANLLTILILSATTIGVWQRLQSKSQFQCACLGTTFSLPLSWVTVAENVVMILMAGFGLIS